MKIGVDRRTTERARQSQKERTKERSALERTKTRRGWRGGERVAVLEDSVVVAEDSAEVGSAVDSVAEEEGGGGGRG